MRNTPHQAASTTSTEHLSIEDCCRHYGLAHIPFQLQDKTTNIFQSQVIKEIYPMLDTMASIRHVMALTGPPGCGKTTVVKSWLQRQDSKRCCPMFISQSSLSASGVLETMLGLLGQTPRFKRSTNLTLLAKVLEDLRPSVPVLILDDAQNYSGIALEEIRLLLGLGPSHRSPLGLVLLGDEYLLGTLRLSSQKALLSRIASSAEVQPLQPQEVAPYLDWHVRSAGLDRELFSEAAQELLGTASEGVPRILNHLAQSALLSAARSGSTVVEAAHVHVAVRQVPQTAGNGAVGGPSR